MVDRKSHIKLRRRGRDKTRVCVACACHRLLVGCERLWVVGSRCGLGRCILPSSEKPKYYASNEHETNYATNDAPSDRPNISFLFRRRCRSCWACCLREGGRIGTTCSNLRWSSRNKNKANTCSLRKCIIKRIGNLDK